MDTNYEAPSLQCLQRICAAISVLLFLQQRVHLAKYQLALGVLVKKLAREPRHLLDLLLQEVFGRLVSQAVTVPLTKTKTNCHEERSKITLNNIDQHKKLILEFLKRERVETIKALDDYMYIEKVLLSE